MSSWERADDDDILDRCSTEELLESLQHLEDQPEPFVILPESCDVAMGAAPEGLPLRPAPNPAPNCCPLTPDMFLGAAPNLASWVSDATPVSYTHLTLPTKRIV
eukprot:TRINITY_DN13436_c0_g1_i1.p2 TRINITY_DN13436_c0_g1~~TRINITY_DN13436_c0_g1_i1.p2  ORF type:complete len:104 (+),score=20.39 TRINITY_DN13436_c0_g1_i1:190-501(+)